MPAPSAEVGERPPMCRPIFVAATRQNVGKTTVSLALMSGLRKRFGKVGFIKPVGQQHVPVTGSDGTELRVDKDVVVMKEYFGLDNIPYEHMSPVRLGCAGVGCASRTPFTQSLAVGAPPPCHP